MKKLYIWALRFSPSRGWHASKERDADNERQAQMWIDVFRSDEPNIEFMASYKAPRINMENYSFVR